MTTSSTAPLPGAAAAVDGRTTEPPDDTLQLGTGPRIDPGTASTSRHVHPFRPLADKTRRPVRRKNEDGEAEVGGSGATGSDLPR